SRNLLSPTRLVMPLNKIRAKIDAIDRKLLKLLNSRADLVHEIGLLKRKGGMATYAPEREEKLLRSLAKRNSGGRLSEQSVRAIYREIMSASLALEKNLTIAYLGPAATWTHQAARWKFGSSVKYSPQSNISEV